MTPVSIAFGLLTILLGVTSSEMTTARMYQKQFQDYDHFQEHISVTEPEMDHYYHHQAPHPHRYRPSTSDKGLDITSFGILAIIKLLLIKIKGMGLGLFLLLKLPIVLFTFLGKLLIFFKVAKFLKLLAIPFLLVGLLPLLLVPLLFLAPLLLPLLLALPIPVLAPATAAAAGRRKRDIGNWRFLQNLIESEKCLERIACTLAADKEPMYTSPIVWGLERLKSLITHPKMASYVSAYKAASENDLKREDCFKKYPCELRFLTKKKRVEKST